MKPVLISAAAALLCIAAPSAAQDNAASDIIFAAGTGETVDIGDAQISMSLANTSDDRDSAAEMAEMATRLDDPVMQDGVARMVEHLTGAMMDLPVGKFAGAIEKARPGTIDKRIDEDATIADLAGGDADGLPRMLGEQSKTAMGMMSSFASAFATMLPEFEAITRDLARDMEGAMKRARKQ